MDMSETGHRAPKLSVGMPVYNGERHIRQALDGLLAQDFADFELIISDNASTDATPEICAEYAARDRRIRFYRNPENMGMAWNFNRVFDLAEGEFFMWAAHDDYHAPAYLKLCLEEFEKQGEIVLCGSRIKFIDDSTGEEIFTNDGFSTTGLSAYEKLRIITNLNNVIGGIVYGIFRRDALRRVMPAKADFLSDIVMLAQSALLGNFATVPEILMFERAGGASSDIKRYVAEIGTSAAGRRYPYISYFRNIRQVISQTDRMSVSEKNMLTISILVQCCYLAVITWLFRMLSGIWPPGAMRVREWWRRLQNRTRKPGAGIKYRI